MKRFLSARTAIVATACVSALAAAACASNAPRAQLSGTSWTASSGAGQPAPSIEFAQDRISGTGGCNRFFGGYSAEDGRMSVTGVGSTRMACAAEIMQRETDFFSVLNAVASYRRDGDQLTLASADGREIVLRRAGP